MKKSRCKLSRKVSRKPLPQKPAKKSRTHIDHGRCWCGAIHLVEAKRVLVVKDTCARTHMIAWRVGKAGMVHRVACDKLAADDLYGLLKSLAFSKKVRVYRPYIM